MAPIKSALARGSGIPFDAMKAAVPEKLLIFPGNAFTNSAAIQMRPRRSRALEKLMERFKRNGVGAEGLVADPNPTCHSWAQSWKPRLNPDINKKNMLNLSHRR
jgi:hypothetical protein